MKLGVTTKSRLTIRLTPEESARLDLSEAFPRAKVYVKGSRVTIEGPGLEGEGLVGRSHGIATFQFNPICIWTNFQSHAWPGLAKSRACEWPAIWAEEGDHPELSFDISSLARKPPEQQHLSPSAKREDAEPNHKNPEEVKAALAVLNAGLLSGELDVWIDDKQGFRAVRATMMVEL